ncbi:MAG: 3-oxoacid CoA-transferase subunit A [Alphaproteobacteria bacterium]|nr:3-oxoacid CoA-transferase subunit A [Alphaproteobacteria bacterium]
MVQIIKPAEAVQFFQNKQTIMIGGFLNCGSPELVIAEILKTNMGEWTLIANDTAYPDSNRGKLICAGKIKKAIISHIGTNPETVRKMNAGEIEIDLEPQGTLAERIRAAGAGLGGILTPVGIGTDVAKNKQIIAVDGRDYLLEKPLRADIALVYATYADRFGNLAFAGSTRNFNVLMPMAADVVIVEAENICEEPLDPNNVVVPGIFIDYIVAGGSDGAK